MILKIKKWNYETHKYDDYEVPDEWNCKTFSFDMDEIINCPHCGKKIKIGDSYTSLELHNDFGFGYAVCDECYKKEWDKRRTKDENYFIKNT